MPSLLNIENYIYLFTKTFNYEKIIYYCGGCYDFCIRICTGTL